MTKVCVCVCGRHRGNPIEWRALCNAWDSALQMLSRARGVTPLSFSTLMEGHVAHQLLKPVRARWEQHAACCMVPPHLKEEEDEFCKEQGMPYVVRYTLLWAWDHMGCHMSHCMDEEAVTTSLTLSILHSCCLISRQCGLEGATNLWQCGSRSVMLECGVTAANCSLLSSHHNVWLSACCSCTTYRTVSP